MRARTVASLEGPAFGWEMGTRQGGFVWRHWTDGSDRGGRVSNPPLQGGMTAGWLRAAASVWRQPLGMGSRRHGTTESRPEMDFPVSGHEAGVGFVWRRWTGGSDRGGGFSNPPLQSGMTAGVASCGRVGLAATAGDGFPSSRERRRVGRRWISVAGHEAGLASCGGVGLTAVTGRRVSNPPLQSGMTAEVASGGGVGLAATAGDGFPSRPVSSRGRLCAGAGRHGNDGE